jgi:hypothetical protein
MHVGLIKWSMPLPALQASSFSSVAHCHLPNNLVIGHNLCKHNNILCLFVGGSRRIPTTQTAHLSFYGRNPYQRLFRARKNPRCLPLTVLVYDPILQ